METNRLETFLESFSKHIEDVPNFHDSNEALYGSLKSTLKDLYDFTKSEEIVCNVPQSKVLSALKKLIVENFDLEQIWQQLELQNTSIVEHMVKDISALLVAKERLVFSFLSKELSNGLSTDDESNSSAADEPEQEIIEDDNSNNESASDSEDEDDCSPPLKKYKESVVDDEFFKLNEMEEFLRKEENPPSKVPNDSDSEEEDVDLFENDSDEDEEGEDEEGEDEAKTARFKDYFVDKRQDEPKRKKNRTYFLVKFIFTEISHFDALMSNPIYEKDYLSQQAAFNQDNQEQQEEEPESHKELKQMMKGLFAKLDSLSNFHFTATAAIPELKVIKKLPAVSMEEVAPVAISDANLLAPEEIKNKPKGDIIGQNERTKTDKKGKRRKKKVKQKIHSQRKSKIEEKKASKKKFLKV
ncbi:hypothetical protein D910_07454 [Dendroctonus ponderosae]|uniref:Uncharacterized protein n=1 Tax=Dendroctonus ponderosae TaxID=77166 RepID=U4UJD7_DENPD|nr:hypothetical protein D910_07454 [Dendroctonus ponderosae]